MCIARWSYRKWKGKLITVLVTLFRWSYRGCLLFPRKHNIVLGTEGRFSDLHCISAWQLKQSECFEGKSLTVYKVKKHCGVSRVTQGHTINCLHQGRHASAKYPCIHAITKSKSTIFAYTIKIYSTDLKIHWRQRITLMFKFSRLYVLLHRLWKQSCTSSRDFVYIQSNRKFTHGRNTASFRYMLEN